MNCDKVGVRYNGVDVPCSLQELLGLFQFDMFGEKLSNCGFLVLQWTESSIDGVSDGKRCE